MPVSAEYDSLLAKVIAWGKDRPSAISRLRRGLREFQIGGVQNDLEFLTQVIDSPAFAAGRVDTTFLDNFHPPEGMEDDGLSRDVALAAAMAVHQNRAEAAVRQGARSLERSAWRTAAWRDQIRGRSS
jgi:acetyl/propionyl-CoA carboxylase alpha subunit